MPKNNKTIQVILDLPERENVYYHNGVEQSEWTCTTDDLKVLVRELHALRAEKREAKETWEQIVKCEKVKI